MQCFYLVVPSGTINQKIKTKDIGWLVSGVITNITSITAITYQTVTKLLSAGTLATRRAELPVYHQWSRVQCASQWQCMSVSHQVQHCTHPITLSSEARKNPAQGGGDHGNTGDCLPATTEDISDGPGHTDCGVGVPSVVTRWDSHIATSHPLAKQNKIINPLQLTEWLFGS